MIILLHFLWLSAREFYTKIFLTESSDKSIQVSDEKFAKVNKITYGGSESLCLVSFSDLNATKQQNFRPVHIESFCRRQHKCDVKIGLCFRKDKKHFGNRRKCYLPALAPFSLMFLKASLFRDVKGRDCVVKSLELQWI